MYRDGPVHRSGKRLLLYYTEVTRTHGAANSLVHWRWRIEAAKQQWSGAGTEQLGRRQSQAHHQGEFRRKIPLWPVFMSYVLSFIYIGIYWNKLQYGCYLSCGGLGFAEQAGCDTIKFC